MEDRIEKGSKPFVSIIIPVYNGEKYIRDTLNSVLSQEYKDVEIICVDDGSPDQSAVIISEYCNHHKNIVYVKQKNQGTGAARNLGIQTAKGEYVCFLDQDDSWCLDFLNNDLIQRVKNENADIYGFGYYRCNENLKRGKYVGVEERVISNGGLAGMNSSWAHHSSFFFRKSLIVDNDIEIVGTRHEDEIFRMMCLYSSKKTVFINKPLFYYRNNSSSVTHKHKVGFYTPLLQSWKKLQDWLTERNCGQDVVVSVENIRMVFYLEMLQSLFGQQMTLEQVREYLNTKEAENTELFQNHYRRLEGKKLEEAEQWINEPKSVAQKYRMAGLIGDIKHRIYSSPVFKGIIDMVRYPIKMSL